MSSKACRQCGIEQPLDDFYRHAQMDDGHLNKCKTCIKENVRAHRFGPRREYVLAYDRARALRPERKSAAAKIKEQWKAQNPDRRSAQNAVNNAIRSGSLQKWPVCALPECSDKPEAHHPDYSRPLDVVWLCPAHHRQAHALGKRLQAA